MNLNEAITNAEAIAATPAKRKPMTPADVTAWALAHGYRLLKNKPTRTTARGNTLRLVLNDLKVRREVRVDHSDGTHGWVRVDSGYYKDLFITPEGFLGGMTR